MLHNNRVAHSVFEILVHGDDLLLVTNEEIDSSAFISSMAKLFDMEIKLDEVGSCTPRDSEPSIHFLGSLWINGEPNRDTKSMLMNCCVTDKPIPRVVDIESAIQGRIYSICGYSVTLPHIWKKLGFPSYVGRRMFVFGEGLAWEQRLNMRMLGTAGQWVTGVAEPWKER